MRAGAATRCCGRPTLFREMLALEGDVGARRLMVRHASRVREIDLGTDAVLMDVDTPEALRRLSTRD